VIKKWQRKLTSLSQLSFRDLITLIIFGSILFILTIGIISWTSWEKESIEKSSRTNAQSIVEILSQDFVRILFLHSTDAAADMSVKLEAFSHIRYVEMYDKSGKFLFSYKHSKELSSFTEAKKQEQLPSSLLNNYHKFLIPIKYQGQIYGSAYVIYSSVDAQKRMADFYSYLYWSIPILLVISFLLALLLQKIIAKPISTMADIVEEISISNNFETRVDNKTRGELGTLADGFNHLMQTIQNTQVQLHSDKERLRVTLESIAEGVIATDANGLIEYMNPVAETLLEKNESDVIGKPLDDVFIIEYEKTTKLITGQLDNCLLHGKIQFNLDNICIRLNEEKIPIQSSIAPICDISENINGAVVVFRNVSDARDMAKKLEHQASHDGLTDLINRNEFEAQLSSIVKNIGNNLHALIYLDLDQFKIVNDTSGHMAGDSMLRQISGIIRNHVRDSDIVARLGGDEFGILLPRCTITQAREIANKLLQVISEFSFKWENRLFRVGASIGVVSITDNSLSHIDLLKQADIACYAAKNLGRNRIHVYEPGDKELAKMHGEMQWVSRIEKAFEKKLFRLYVQKVVPTVSSNELESYEVLIRFIEEDGTINFPGSFLGSAERYGLMSRIDEWVIENLLGSEHAINLINAIGNVQFNVNISYTTLGNPNSIERIRQMVVKSKFPADCLCFEFTETAASIDVPATLKFMRNMKYLGCKFALDDFGSGLSSFGYLKNLPVDFIKIDGTLVKDIASDQINLAMVESINHIGKVMGIKTIAEYVHSKEVSQLLKKINVGYLQGYYIHRPMPIEELEIVDRKLLAANLARKQSSKSNNLS